MKKIFYGNLGKIIDLEDIEKTNIHEFLTQYDVDVINYYFVNQNYFSLSSRHNLNGSELFNLIDEGIKNKCCSGSLYSFEKADGRITITINNISNILKISTMPKFENSINNRALTLEYFVQKSERLNLVGRLRIVDGLLSEEVGQVFEFQNPKADELVMG